MNEKFSQHPGQILREDRLGLFTPSPFLPVHFHWTTTHTHPIANYPLREVGQEEHWPHDKRGALKGIIYKEGSLGYLVKGLSLDKLKLVKGV